MIQCICYIRLGLTLPNKYVGGAKGWEPSEIIMIRMMTMTVAIITIIIIIYFCILNWLIQRQKKKKKIINRVNTVLNVHSIFTTVPFICF